MLHTVVIVSVFSTLALTFAVGGLVYLFVDLVQDIKSYRIMAKACDLRHRMFVKYTEPKLKSWKTS